MIPLVQGCLVAREARSQNDIQRALDLRGQAFHGRHGAKGTAKSYTDEFDAAYRHLLIEKQGSPVASFRARILEDAAALGASYSGRHYGLAPLAGLKGPFADVGRLAVRPGEADPDILRLVWGALARLVDAHQLRFLMGCTSFRGADPGRHASALAALCPSHLGPPDLLPLRTSPSIVDLAQINASPDPTRVAPLLRSYLALGAWVSDHAVIDRLLDTLHVFTFLDIAAIPPARAQVLRRIAAAPLG